MLQVQDIRLPVSILVLVDLAREFRESSIRSGTPIVSILVLVDLARELRIYLENDRRFI